MRRRSSHFASARSYLRSRSKARASAASVEAILFSSRASSSFFWIRFSEGCSFKPCSRTRMRVSSDVSRSARCKTPATNASRSARSRSSRSFSLARRICSSRDSFSDCRRASFGYAAGAGQFAGGLQLLDGADGIAQRIFALEGGNPGVQVVASSDSRLQLLQTGQQDLGSSPVPLHRGFRLGDQLVRALFKNRPVLQGQLAGAYDCVRPLLPLPVRQQALPFRQAFLRLGAQLEGGLRFLAQRHEIGIPLEFLLRLAEHLQGPVVVAGIERALYF